MVTEFHYHKRDDFVIIVDYFSEAEIRGQFQELLEGYLRYHNRDPSDPGDGGDGFKEHAKLAQDTINAAFGSRFQWSEVLNTPLETVVDKLLDWTKQLHSPLRDGGISTQRCYKRSNPELCSEKLMDLTASEHSKHKGAVWPFIRKIRCVSEPTSVSTAAADSKVST